MTDNEIIKAWDVLCKFDFFGGQRAGRELWNEKPADIQDKDIEAFSKDVAFLKDFINCQKAEKEALIAGQETLQKYIAEQKVEIERLTTLAELGNMRANDYRAMRDKLKNANADIEFLKNELSNCEFLKKELEIDMRTAKAEAIKEFAERLKDKFPNGYGAFNAFDVIEIIDETYKETME